MKRFSLDMGRQTRMTGETARRLGKASDGKSAINAATTAGHTRARMPRIVALGPFVCYIRSVQLWTAFQHTGWVGKSVLAVLLLFSIGSWGVMIVVGQRFRTAGLASRRFMGAFRRAKHLADVQAATAPNASSSLVGLFRAGY